MSSRREQTSGGLTVSVDQGDLGEVLIQISWPRRFVRDHTAHPFRFNGEESLASYLHLKENVEEAVYLADRVFVLDNGKFVNIYKNPFPRPREERLRDDSSFLEAKTYLKSCYGGGEE